MTENYIFDLYGTLLDIHTDEEQMSLWLLMKHFYSRDPFEIKHLYQRYCSEEFERVKMEKDTEYPEIDIIRVFKRMHPFASVPIETIAKEFRKASRIKLKPYPDTIETLKELRNRGKKIYLLSNAQEAFTLDEIEDTGLTPLFDGICISSAFGIKKPDVRFMKHLLDTYHLNMDKCVMIGNDFQADIQMAVQAGMKAVHINTDHYDESFIKSRPYPFEEISTLSELL